MWAAYMLIYVPILLFVLAFLYETYLSFWRIRRPKKATNGYVDATWEVTHTLLVFGVVMMLMLYTQVIDELASRIFIATFLAAIALGLRGAAYIHLFYVRTDRMRRDWADWAFALSHVAAAVLLVIVVIQASWFIFTENPPANTHFIPAFMPGLALVLAVCVIPILKLYSTRGTSGH